MSNITPEGVQAMIAMSDTAARANVGRIHAVVIGGKVLGREELDGILVTVRTQFQTGVSADPSRE